MATKGKIQPKRGEEEKPSPQAQQSGLPSPQVLGVTRHKNTFHKLKDWDLNVAENTVIMGDSNLNRIQSHYLPGIQIDSYPGATVRHAETVLSKIPTEMENVKEVILSFEVNSREQRTKTEGDISSTVNGGLTDSPEKIPRSTGLHPLHQFFWPFLIIWQG